jgi:hypothetical protein
MKKLVFLSCALFLLALDTRAQDEGSAVAKARFERDKSFYLSGGPSIVVGKNLGDYKNGINVEVGFAQRLNKVFSIGPNLSYINFKYDEEKTYPYYYDVENDIAIEYFQEGGDISLISLGCNFKLNFIPVGDDTPLSIYGVANPFISSMTRKAFKAYGDFYGDLDGDIVYDDWLLSAEFTKDDIPQLAKDSKITGGVLLGFGIEFAPTKPVSLFFQASFAYTMAIKYSATESFLKDEFSYVDGIGTIYYDADETIYQEDFPIVNKGFSSLALKAGISFNF